MPNLSLNIFTIIKYATKCTCPICRCPMSTQAAMSLQSLSSPGLLPTQSTIKPSMPTYSVTLTSHDYLKVQPYAYVVTYLVQSMIGIISTNYLCLYCLASPSSPLSILQSSIPTWYKTKFDKIIVILSNRTYSKNCTANISHMEFNTLMLINGLFQSYSVTLKCSALKSHFDRADHRRNQGWAWQGICSTIKTFFLCI